MATVVIKARSGLSFSLNTIGTLTTKADTLKDEIIDIHRYYIKLKPNN